MVGIARTEQAPGSLGGEVVSPSSMASLTNYGHILGCQTM